MRRAWLALQPEELVRQALVALLVERGYRLAHMQLERAVGQHRERLDLLVHDAALRPYLLAECKAPGQSLVPAARQLASYNRVLRAPFALAVDGSQALCRRFDGARRAVDVLDALPPPPLGKP